MAHKTDAAHKTETLAVLDSLIGKATGRLMSVPDYIELIALKKARAEIVGTSGRKPESFVDDVTGERLVVVPTGDFSAKKPSQLEAAKAALAQSSEPLTTPQMVERVRALGGKVGGNNPNINLGSTLSRAEEFRSVRWKGEAAWWFKNQPLPVHAIPDRHKEAAE